MVWIIEQHEVPLVQMNLMVKAGSAADPAGKFGVGEHDRGNMLDEGAGGKSALELADAIEFLGGQLATSSTFDYSSVPHVGAGRAAGGRAAAHGRRRAAADVPAAELERLRKERLTRLLQARDDPAAIMEIAFPRIVFGEKHRYGTAGRRRRGRSQGDDARRSARRSIRRYYRPENSRRCWSSVM